MSTTSTQGSPRRVRRLRGAPERHWVGDGFPVRTLFAYPRLGAELSPFLLLDHAGPAEFPPTAERRGVGEHPHRGFETVTIVYDGEVEHRDSAGGGGRIGPGDVQWMTAASGVVHEELHGRDFAARGGRFEMVQLWVNLPARDKTAPPGYQGITAAEIPVVTLPDGAGTARVVAGELAGVRGPARTFTPMQVWDLDLAADARTTLTVPADHNAVLAVLHGDLLANGEPIATDESALFERGNGSIHLEPRTRTRALLLAGEPIEEPIVGQGPFVMNDPAEIRRAMDDYASGRMGHLS